jgi:predicted ATPase with chaperone activity
VYLRPQPNLTLSKRISGPLLDRIDLHVEVPRIKFDKLSNDTLSESSASIRARVETAREIQTKRFKDTIIHANSEMRNNEIREYCKLNNESIDFVAGSGYTNAFIGTRIQSHPQTGTHYCRFRKT